MKLSAADKKRISEASKAFNRKRSDFAKRIPENASYLPKRTNAKDIAKTVKSRTELNSMLRDMRNFAKKRSVSFVQFGDLVVTDFQANIAKRELAKVNKKRAEIRKERGLEDSPNPTMNIASDFALKDKGIPQFRLQSGFSEWLRNLYAQSTNEYYSAIENQYVENLKRAIAKDVPNYAEKLLPLVDKLSPAKIMQMRAQGSFAIEFVYGPEGEYSKAMGVLGEFEKMGMLDNEQDELYREYLDNGDDEWDNW